MCLPFSPATASLRCTLATMTAPEGLTWYTGRAARREPPVRLTPTTLTYLSSAALDRAWSRSQRRSSIDSVPTDSRS